jgi:hypothetical protein
VDRWLHLFSVRNSVDQTSSNDDDSSHGNETLATVLSFAFGSLGAEFARTAAFTNNAASQGVTRHIGYRENGRARHVNRGEAAETIRFMISRAEFTARDFPPIKVENLEPCLPMFGL